MNQLLRIRTSMLKIQRNMCAPPAGTPATTGSSRTTMSPKYSPSEFQKTLLVWTKKYKSKEEIPKLVSPDVIDRARSEARIKIANLAMLLTALASIGAILAGKAAVKRGESVQQMNLDWHKQYRENYDKEHGQTKD